jgi:Xaa-Pro aminopeptidase
MAVVDAGMVELIASTGVRITSSADLFQHTSASWDERALQSHLDASRHVEETLWATFDLIRDRVYSDTRWSEYDVQEFILEEFDKRVLETEDRPYATVNSHSGDPHYEPTREHHSAIRKGDWVLIDLWARHPGNENVFADITWVAYVGKKIPEPYVHVFNIVAAARAAVVARLKEAWRRGEHCRAGNWMISHGK